MHVYEYVLKLHQEESCTAWFVGCEVGCGKNAANMFLLPGLLPLLTLCFSSLFPLQHRHTLGLS